MKNSHRSRLSLGKLAYKFYYAPVGWTRTVLRQGVLARVRAHLGHNAMRRAAWTLPPVVQDTARLGDAPEVHLFTGARFWEQTAFCLWSLARHADEPLRFVIWDDGSLEGEQVGLFHRIFPGAVRVMDRRAVEAGLDRHLPADRFPTLRARRLTYPHLRKITDVHAGGSGWKLVIDSDMLFFRRPDAMLGWMRQPACPLLMIDVATSYGRTPEALAQICGHGVPEKLNVGICGLRSDALDWDALERWHAEFVRLGVSYLDEQALVAMTASAGEHQTLPTQDYVCLPGAAEVAAPTAALHHYVAEAKLLYFREAWRRALDIAADRGASR